MGDVRRCVVVRRTLLSCEGVGVSVCGSLHYLKLLHVLAVCLVSVRGEGQAAVLIPYGLSAGVHCYIRPARGIDYCRPLCYTNGLFEGFLGLVSSSFLYNWIG